MGKALRIVPSPAPDAYTSSDLLVPFTRRTSWPFWALILLLSLIIHALFLSLPHDWFAAPAVQDRVEVRQIDPKTLEAIRRRNRADAQQFLLNKDRSLPKDQEAPKDAKYFSDRNIRVEKEQRSNRRSGLPQSGAQERAKQSARPKISDLGKLGVPMGLQKNQATAHAGEPNPDPGDQTILDKSVPEGGETLLNAQESVYYSFYARIYESVLPLWQSLAHDAVYRQTVLQGDYTTLADITLDRSGNLVDVKVNESSGIAGFDDAVTSTWKRLARFPNPPEGLLDAKGQVHLGWQFTVRVDQDYRFNSLPPERIY